MSWNKQRVSAYHIHIFSVRFHVSELCAAHRGAIYEKSCAIFIRQSETLSWSYAIPKSPSHRQRNRLHGASLFCNWVVTPYLFLSASYHFPTKCDPHARIAFLHWSKGSLVGQLRILREMFFVINFLTLISVSFFEISICYFIYFDLNIRLKLILPKKA